VLPIGSVLLILAHFVIIICIHVVVTPHTFITGGFGVSRRRSHLAL
jgi:hypothetical protein